MIKTGILNPQINSLLARVRHTNLLVIADRGFPFFPTLETVDIALIDDLPTVLDVFRALESNFVIGKIWMAKEFESGGTLSPKAVALRSAITKYEFEFEPHVALKKRAASAIGLIRTADVQPYANLIIESA